MKKIILTILTILFLTSLCSLAFSYDIAEYNNRMSVGLLIGPCFSMYDIGDFFMDQTDTFWQLVDGDAVEGWNGGTEIDLDGFDANGENRVGYMDAEPSGPMGLHIEIDVKFRFLNLMYARVGFRSTPVISGGAYDVTYFLDDTAYDNTVPVNAVSSFKGYQLVVPVQIGLYVPTGIGGGVYFGVGPSIFIGKFTWSLDMSSSTANLASLFSGDDFGQIAFSDVGIGATYTLGWEQEILDTGIMLFFNISIDQYYPSSMEGNGTVNGVYDASTGQLNANLGNDGVDVHMIQVFDRKSDRFTYNPTSYGSTDLEYKWAPDFGGYQFMIGVQYLLPSFL